MNLDDVLDENEYVLIDFWASWCSPCIAEFPTLKKLYSTYNNDGFEIVSVSLDRQSYEWKVMSEKQELPWIDLADTEGMDGSTATTYSVEGIPLKIFSRSKWMHSSFRHRPFRPRKFFKERIRK